MEILTPALLTLPLAFAVAILCGMAFRRGITAFVIGVGADLGLVGAAVHLDFDELAAGCRACSGRRRRCWWFRGHGAAIGCWIARRRAMVAARPVRAVAFALLSAGYIGFRVWSVPDVGPIAPPAAWIGGVDSAPIVRAKCSRPLPRSRSAASSVQRQPAGTSSAETRTLDLIRRAAARPDCRFEQPEKQTC